MTDSNNRMIVFASILGAILATSILALNPSTITNANAQMYEDQYDYDYKNDYYQSDYQYGYDDDNYYNQDYNDYGYDDYGYDLKVQLEFADKYGDNYHKDYSKHPTKDHKFVCKTGQFEGFFVKSPMVCNLEIPEGPEGPQGPMGLPGVDGQDGAQGPQGPAGITTVNSTNYYQVQGDPVKITAPFVRTSGVASCDSGDTAISGGYLIGALGEIPIVTGFVREDIDTWITFLEGKDGDQITTRVYCFDNPPAHIP